MIGNTLFSQYQYGFIGKKSTTLQLLYVLDRWCEIIDDRGTIDAIYMEFMKALTRCHMNVSSEKQKLAAYADHCWCGYEVYLPEESKEKEWAKIHLNGHKSWEEYHKA